MINPLVNAFEVWLAIFLNLPLPILMLIYLFLFFNVAVTVVQLLWGAFK